MTMWGLKSRMDAYPGICVGLIAKYPPIAVPLTVDVTTGDKITPHEVEYMFPMLFDDRVISIIAYNLETVLAEKLETVVSRGVTNTRPRDFYDIYTLWKLRGSALEQTATKRGSLGVIAKYAEILTDVLASKQMQGFWKKYRADYEYAKDISFEEAVEAAKNIMAQRQ